MTLDANYHLYCANCSQLMGVTLRPIAPLSKNVGGALLDLPTHS